MKPKLIEFEEINVAGLGANFISALSPRANNFQVIPRLWKDFHQRAAEIRSAIGQTRYGVCEELPPGSRRSDPHEMYYLACVEVSSLNHLPPEIVGRTIRAGKYALFTHFGKLDTLGNTMANIYGKWIAQAGLKMRPAPHLEIYDERFHPGADGSEMDICVPVQ